MFARAKLLGKSAWERASLSLKCRALFVPLLMLWTATATAVPPRFEGPPSSGLAPETYSRVEARQLKGAKVVWLNKRYLSHHGQAAISTQDIEEAKARLLDSFAFLIPNKKVPASVLGEKTKLFYPSRYGGPGMNGNYGDGRAAAVGDFQLKGIGPTDMVGAKADLDHMSGGLSAIEAIPEAIWSVILAQEAPHGCNEVIAIIDTGLQEQKVVSQPRYLLVRENPIRPAHFIPNLSPMSPEKRALDDQRVLDNASRLRDLLWLDHAAGDQAATVDDLILNFTDKVADQWAYLHANLLHHGAVTPSNIDLSGKLLDLATMTTLPGALPSMAFDLLPFGDINVVDLYMIKPFFTELEASQKSPLRITYQEAQQRLHRTYEKSYRLHLLKLVGTPDALGSDVNELPSAIKLALAIDDLRNAGYQGQVATKVQIPEQMGQYDVPAILRIMAHRPTGVPDLGALSRYVPDQQLRIALTVKFRDYYDDVYAAGRARGFTESYLLGAIHDRVQSFNVDRVALRRNLKNIIENLVRANLSRARVVDLQAWMDGMIDRNLIEQNEVVGRQPIADVFEKIRNVGKTSSVMISCSEVLLH